MLSGITSPFEHYFSVLGENVSIPTIDIILQAQSSEKPVYKFMTYETN